MTIFPKPQTQPMIKGKNLTDKEYLSTTWDDNWLILPRTTLVPRLQDNNKRMKQFVQGQGTLSRGRQTCQNQFKPVTQPTNNGAGNKQAIKTAIERTPTADSPSQRVHQGELSEVPKPIKQQVFFPETLYQKR